MLNKVCHVCREQTDLACSDCRIDLGATVYVCSKSSCRDEHEAKHHDGSTIIHSDGSISGNAPLTFHADLGSGGYGD